MMSASMCTPPSLTLFSLLLVFIPHSLPLSVAAFGIFLPADAPFFCFFVFFTEIDCPHPPFLLRPSVLPPLCSPSEGFAGGSGWLAQYPGETGEEFTSVEPMGTNWSALTAVFLWGRISGKSTKKRGFCCCCCCCYCLKKKEKKRLKASEANTHLDTVHTFSDFSHFYNFVHVLHTFSKWKPLWECPSFVFTY